MNEQIDFKNIQKQAELASTTITEDHQKKESDQSNNRENGLQVNSEDESEEANSQHDNPIGTQALTEAEEKTLQALKLRDVEVKAHERAHASAGGTTTGAPSYTFELGPDGKKYAVEGEVSVDLSIIEGDPRATIAKLQKVHEAALAPVEPSSQDIKVANSAAQLIAQAQSELLAEQLEEPTKVKEPNRVIDSNDSLSDSSNASAQSSDFDQSIAETLAAQERIAPSRPSNIDQRAGRIESFYSTINQAYEKPDNHQFELIA